MWPIDQHFSVISTNDITTENPEVYTPIEAKFNQKNLQCILVPQGTKATMEKMLRSMKAFLLKKLARSRPANQRNPTGYEEKGQRNPAGG